MATSVPVPMAIPICGSKRGSVVDAIARHGHDAAFLPKGGDNLAFLIGQHAGLHLGYADAPRDGLCCGVVGSRRHR